MRTYDNVRIIARKPGFAVFKGDKLVGVSPTFNGAWDLAKVTV